MFTFAEHAIYFDAFLGFVDKFRFFVRLRRDTLPFAACFTRRFAHRFFASAASLYCVPRLAAISSFDLPRFALRIACSPVQSPVQHAASSESAIRRASHGGVMARSIALRCSRTLARARCSVLTTRLFIVATTCFVSR